jgi:hypothetical protein
MLKVIGMRLFGASLPGLLKMPKLRTGDFTGTTERPRRLHATSVRRWPPQSFWWVSTMTFTSASMRYSDYLRRTGEGKAGAW